MEIKWFNLCNSNILEDQVKYNIAMSCEGYVNGCRDCDYEPLTKSDWQEYIYNTMQETFETASGTDIGRDASKHLRFYGKAKTMKLIDTYLGDYEGVQKYIKREGENK